MKAYDSQWKRTADYDGEHQSCTERVDFEQQSWCKNRVEMFSKIPKASKHILC